MSNQQVNTFLNEIKGDHWPIQIIQDVLALGLDIPLRIFDCEQAKNFYYQAIRKHDFIREYWPTKDEFEKSIKEIATLPLKEAMTQLSEGRTYWKKNISRYKNSYWKTY